MKETLSRTFKSPVLDTLKALPQQQVLLLCAMVLRVRRLAAAAAASQQAAAAAAAQEKADGKGGTSLAAAASAPPPPSVFATAAANAARQPCTFGELYKEYQKACASQKIKKLPEQEVIPLCRNLEAAAVFRIEKAGKQARGKDPDLQVTLLTHEDDLRAATREQRFFQTLLGAP